MKMQNKDMILNYLVTFAASIMEDKFNFNKMVLDQLLENKPYETNRIAKLRKINERINAAITLIREFDGCWM